jgi:uncharacterized protein YjaZ
MSVIQTDKWLNEEFYRPKKICEKLTTYFKGQDESEVYNQLIQFGMYRPSRSSKNNLDHMKEQKVWDKVQQLLTHYKNKWSGPDIPIFLFPLGQPRGFFMRREGNKSGVSYPDKMFLFLSPIEDPKELEALFVHEYHHVCRLRKLNKKMEDYTLLDSIIIEGLAEYAVLKNCGQDYLAKWCRIYSEKEISSFWDKYMVSQLSKRKNERTHDELLYGGGRIPNLLGYAVGYKIIENFYKNNNYSTKLSFIFPAAKYVEDKNNLFQ